MATERRPDPRTEQWKQGRAIKADFLAAATSGIEHRARKENWSNERQSSVFGVLVRVYKTLAGKGKDGDISEKMVSEHKGLANLHREAVEDDAAKMAAKAAKAAAKAEKGKKPYPAEVAEQAQADDPPDNPPAKREALRLLSAIGGKKGAAPEEARH